MQYTHTQRTPYCKKSRPYVLNLSWPEAAASGLPALHGAQSADSGSQTWSYRHRTAPRIAKQVQHPCIGDMHEQDT